MNYKGYILNLIDTPGHVDFSYEVSRSLAACEGVLLVVDATQGIQAQTLAHMQLIKNKNLKVIPVINKIDLPTAKVAETKKELHDVFGMNEDDCIEISAKNGINIDKVLQAVIDKIPPPRMEVDKPLRCLVFSSKFDAHKGVVVFVRVMEGSIDITSLRKTISQIPYPIHLLATKAHFLPVEIGFFAPSMKSVESISAGEVGYIATGLKEPSLARSGDTLSLSTQKVDPLPGYMEPKPMVYISLFPTDSDGFASLRDAVEKLHLSDSSFTYTPMSSPALGKGYQCGFLGLLHGEVVKERLENEFNLDLIASAPTVEYEILKTDCTLNRIHNPQDYPDPTVIKEVREPVMIATIFTPAEMIGPVMQLLIEKRGESAGMEYVGNTVKLTYALPLSEMIIDFFDRLKSITSGYASLDYEFFEYRVVDAVRLDIHLNRVPAEAFAQIVVREKAQAEANRIVEKLKELIPRHQFQIPIQAAIGGKILARADVKSFRKDVIQKLYGGDRTRKDKLLEAQKKGKKKMRNIGAVEVPKEVFMKVFQRT
jgi:GTP-binding protein LepA